MFNFRSSLHQLVPRVALFTIWRWAAHSRTSSNSNSKIQEFLSIEHILHMNCAIRTPSRASLWMLIWRYHHTRLYPAKSRERNLFKIQFDGLRKSHLNGTPYPSSRSKERLCDRCSRENSKVNIKDQILSRSNIFILSHLIISTPVRKLQSF